MKKVQKFALLYLLFLAVAVYSYSAARFKLFPQQYIEPLISDFQKFSAGDPLEKKTNVKDKLLNDLGFSFERLLYNYPQAAWQQATERSFDSLENRAEMPLVYVHPMHQRGHRVIIGALDLPSAFWGGILLGPGGDILHTWPLSTAHLPDNEAKEQLKNLYGVHVFPDGSVIFNMQEVGGGIVKVDACGNELWNIPGAFHHAISPDDEGYFWSFSGSSLSYDQDMVRVDVETGEIVQTIDMTRVRKANPTLNIWDLQNPAFRNRKRLKKDGNMTHGNDIDPLPASLAAEFPDFEAGDLVVSYATTNLVFVVDPDTLLVKWWRVGISDYQHDPDWEPDGRIVIYSNNFRDRKFASIVAADPVSYEHEIVLDGEEIDFLPGINGRHQLTAYNTRMVASSQQGWAFEIDPNNEIVFSFVNNVNSDERKAMHLAEAWRFEEDYFEREFWHACQ